MSARYLGLRSEHWRILRSLLRQADRLEREIERAYVREVRRQVPDDEMARRVLTRDRTA